MTPIHVIAHMGEPLVWYGDAMHLDGLLAGAVWKEEKAAGRADEYEDPNYADWPVDFDLPLDQWSSELCGRSHARLLDDNGDLWGWRASDAFPDGPQIESSHALRRMIDTTDFVRRTEADTYKRSTGALKPKDKTYPTLMVPRLEWWAVATNVERVCTLLNRYIDGLGKLRHHGMGRVLHWEVEEASQDWSLTRDGETMRVLPTSAVDASRAPQKLAIRPPYWHPSRRVEHCYPSGTGTEVDDE